MSNVETRASGITIPENASFYRDEFTPAQRRRVEALILVHRMWPALFSDSAVKVASWIVRGEARVVARPVEAGVGGGDRA